MADSPMKIEVKGEGPSVLLLHGFLETPAMWKDWVSRSENSIRFINVQLPGHSPASHWGKDQSIASVAQMVWDQVEHLKPVCVVGHSLGGYIALELLLIDPDLRAILLNSNYWEDSALKKEERKRLEKVVAKNYSYFLREAIPNLFLETKREECSKWINALIETAASFHPQNVVHVSQAMRSRRDFSSRLEHLKGRLSMVLSPEDPLIRKDIFETKVVQEFDRDSLYLLEGSGHMSMMEDPEETIAVLEKVVFN